MELPIYDEILLQQEKMRLFATIPNIREYFSRFPGNDPKLRAEVIKLLDPQSDESIAWQMYLVALSKESPTAIEKYRGAKRKLPKFTAYLDRLNRREKEDE